MVPLKHYLINIIEDIAVFQGLKVFNYDTFFLFSSSGTAPVTFVEKPQISIQSPKN